MLLQRGLSAAVTTREWLETSAGRTDVILQTPVTGVGSLYIAESARASVKTIKNAPNLSLAWEAVVKDASLTALTAIRKGSSLIAELFFRRTKLNNV